MIVWSIFIILYFLYDFGREVRVFENRLKPLQAHSPVKAKVYVCYKLIQKSYMKLCVPLGMIGLMVYSGTLSWILSVNLLLLLGVTHLFYWHRSSKWAFIALGAVLLLLTIVDNSLLLYVLPVVIIGTCVYYWTLPAVAYSQSRRVSRWLIQLEDFAIVLGILGFSLLNKGGMNLQQVPLEQLLLVLVMLYLTLLEVSYTDNKLRLHQHRAKFYVNLTRRHYPTLAFLTERQIQELKSSSLIWLSVIGAVMVFTNQLGQFVILLLAMLATLLYRCDFIVYHYLLGRSIVYDNNVTRLLIEGVYNGIVFSCVMLTLIRKMAPTLNNEAFVSVESYALVGYTIFFVTSIVFFLWRQWRLYSMS